MNRSPRDLGSLRDPDRDGAVVAEAAPVKDVLDALRRPALPHELARERDAVAIISARIRAAAPIDAAGSAPMRARSRIGLSAIFAAAALTAFSGLAVAGELPGTAQSTAADVLSKLGVTVPGASPRAGTHPDVRGRSTAAHPPSPSDAPRSGEENGDDPASKPATGSDGQAGHGSSTGKGAAVSQLARTTSLTGRDKGAAISALASGGKSHAGNPPGQAAKQPTGGGSAGDRGSRPSHPDAPAAGEQRDGTGAARSGGHSTAGAGNRPS